LVVKEKEIIICVGSGRIAVPRLFRDIGWDKLGLQEVEIIRN